MYCVQLSPPIRKRSVTDGPIPVGNSWDAVSRRAGQFIGGAASGLAWVELVGLLVGRFVFSPSLGITRGRGVLWQRLGLLHRALLALCYSASRLLAQWHSAAATVADNGVASDWGRRSNRLAQIAVVLHLAELPHIYYM